VIIEVNALKFTGESIPEQTDSKRIPGFAKTKVRIPAKEIAHSDLMSIKIEAWSRWTVIC
jgi:hypothetical protein